jgi:solute carrier family 25 carnitine/acylcarnitine transporter 20/29
MLQFLGFSADLPQLWAVIYPIDMIKSRMQTDGFTPATGQKYKSTMDCVRTVWRTEGFSAFTRGIVPTLIRCVYPNPLPSVTPHNYLSSPFANGATFLGFEMAIRVLDRL